MFDPSTNPHLHYNSIWSTAGVDYTRLLPLNVELTRTSTSDISVVILMDDQREMDEVVEVSLEENQLLANGQQLPFPSDRVEVSPSNTLITIQDVNGNL